MTRGQLLRPGSLAQASTSDYCARDLGPTGLGPSGGHLHCALTTRPQAPRPRHRAGLPPGLLRQPREPRAEPFSVKDNHPEDVQLDLGKPGRQKTKPRHKPAGLPHLPTVCSLAPHNGAGRRRRREEAQCELKKAGQVTSISNATHGWAGADLGFA